MVSTVIPTEDPLAFVLRMGIGWYWRQDSQLRFLSVTGGVVAAGKQPEFFVGKSRWELPNLMPAEFWAAHRATLEARKPFYDLEYGYPGLKGSNEEPRWVSISGEPMWGDKGQFLGYHGVAQDITPRKRVRLAIAASERRFEDFASSLSDWLWETDDQLCFTWISTSVHSVQQIEATSFLGLPLNHFHYGRGNDIEAAKKVDQALENREPFHDFVFRVDHEGGDLWLAKSGTPYYSANGQFAGYRGINRDISPRRKAELQLQEREQRFSAIFEQSPLGMIEWDVGLHVTEWNAAAERIFGWSRADVVNCRADRLAAMGLGHDLTSELEAALQDAHSSLTWVKKEGPYRHKTGKILVCTWTNAVLRDASGQVRGLVSMVEDVTAQNHAALRIEHLASHDNLTNLPNRAHLLVLLEAAIVRSRTTGEAVAVLMLNLDRFKQVNDSYGHAAGDNLLQTAAQRLRETIGPGNIAARVGGDEFAVLVTRDTSELGVRHCAHAVQAVLASPYRFEGHDIECTTSIGVACSPADGDTPLGLLQAADAAMTYVKAQGRNNIQFFTAELREVAAERMSLAQDLKLAVRRNELQLCYQPQVDAVTGVMTGVEALVRWLHPQRGLLWPTQFIPLAEEAGLIGEIGHWVLTEACATLRQWQDNGLKGITMSVNLSALQLKNPLLVQEVAEVLAKNGLPGHLLELELTESVAMADPQATIAILHRLRQLDVLLAIDDFGTGYSSLSYLKLLPIQRLKLDRTFVNDMVSNSNDAAICSATIALAHKLKLGVVAEGVETDLQRAYLLRDGCDTLQGFLLSHPVSAEAAATFGLNHSSC